MTSFKAKIKKIGNSDFVLIPAWVMKSHNFKTKQTIIVEV